MSGTGWQSAVPPVAERFGVAGWLRLALRGAVLGGTVFGGLAGLLLLRLIEWPVHGSRRPWTPYITQGVCRVALAIIGLPLSVTGLALDRPGAVVANHGSWLDIFVLNAADRITFVSKVEVAGWPGIGWLARATGTVFIRRDAREATKQKAAFEARLAEARP